MENVRIDKGVKRGKRGPPKGYGASSPRRQNGQFVNVLPNEPEAIKAAIHDYQSGATLKQIAQKHGVSTQAVYGWLLGDMGGEQHQMLVTQALTARIATADDNLDSADSPLDLARAREQARFTRMDLERRRPNLYGQKQEVTHLVTPVLNIVVAPQATALQQDQTLSDTSQVIEHKP